LILVNAPALVKLLILQPDFMMEQVEGSFHADAATS
jgi:hypothetical protein